MAVRLAVAEVQVVTENKDFLAQHGVDIDALESTHSANRAVARSTTTLLVKNLPATTVPDEIESMFARYGSIAGEYLFFLLYLFFFSLFLSCVHGSSSCHDFRNRCGSLAAATPTPATPITLCLFVSHIAFPLLSHVCSIYCAA